MQPMAQGGGTTVDELVRQRIDQMLDEYDDEQIKYQDEKQAELRELEQDKKETIARIADDAEDEIEYMQDRIKHEMKASKEIGNQSDEYRRE